MSQAYERLSIEQFGRQLLTTGDLDPLYIALARSGMPSEERARWLIAYWCFYHAGASSYLAEYEGHEFWMKMMTAAINHDPSPLGGRWPRAPERRHFRGNQAIQAVGELSLRYGDSPENMVGYLAHDEPMPCTEFGSVPCLTFEQVSLRAREHRGFGEWIAFKIADMLDALELISVDFSAAGVFMYKDPRLSALMTYDLLAEKQLVVTGAGTEADEIRLVLQYLQVQFSDLHCPHRMERGIAVQELETVLCKHKSHLKGHYPLLNDTYQITAGLTQWAQVSKLARQLLAAMPTGEEIQ